MELKLTMNDKMAQLLSVLGEGSVEDALMVFVRHAVNGVYRPLSWERRWLVECFGEHWQSHLVAGDPYGTGYKHADLVFQRPSQAFLAEHKYEQTYRVPK